MIMIMEEKKSEVKWPIIFAAQQEKALKMRQESYQDRRLRLVLMEKWILQHRTKIHQALAADMGKSADETDLSELFPVLLEIRKFKKNLKNWMRPKKVSAGPLFLGTTAYIQYEPKGTSLIIAPWNYPFNLTLGPLVAALAAGNTAIIKPSEFTPATSQLLEEMISALFPLDEVTVAIGDAKVSTELLTLPFDHVFFTGSPRVGKLVMEAAAKNLSSVTLELGGKSPTIIDASAELTDTAQKISWGKWINAGQTCVAPDYVYVHESIKDHFVNELKKAIDQQYGKFEHYTSVIHDGHLKRLQQLIGDAISKGGKLVEGSDVPKSGRKLHPVIITDVSVEAKLMQEEIFGPVLPILTFKDLDEAILHINSQPKPLALYVFGNSSTIHRVSKATSSGSLVANDCVLQFGHGSLPFGGVNNSGIGKSHGHHGFVAFSNEKSVLKQRTGATMAKTLYQPYTTIKRKTLDFMIKYMG